MIITFDKDVQLSENFWLSEFLRSEMAVRHGIKNVPNARQLVNLVRLAQFNERVKFEVLDGAAMLLSSGLRVLELNRLLKSKDSSQHPDGCAEDFTAPRFGSPREVAKAIAKSPLPYDQVIYEYDAWVHMSIPSIGARPRREVLTINHAGVQAGIV